MPGEKVGRAVDRVGLVHVHGDVVVKVVLGCRELGIDGWESPEAFYCLDVVLSLSTGEELPEESECQLTMSTHLEGMLRDTNVTRGWGKKAVKVPVSASRRIGEGAPIVASTLRGRRLLLKRGFYLLLEIAEDCIGIFGRSSNSACGTE